MLGAIHKLNHKQPNVLWMMILIWSSIVWVLLYLPLDVSRRFINGWHISIALIAFYGFRYLYRQISKAWLRVAFAAAAFTVLVSSLSFYLFVSLFFTDNTYTTGYYYVSADEEQAISYLARETDRRDLLLVSDMKTAFIVASEVDRLVFRGHDHQTPRSHLRQQELDWFFASPDGARSLERRGQFVNDRNFSYVIVNDLRLMQPAAWLLDAPFVEKVLDTATIDVYRVIS